MAVALFVQGAVARDRPTDGVGRVLRTALWASAVDQRARVALGLCHSYECAGLAPKAAEIAIYLGRVVDALDVALPTQAAYACFVEEACTPGPVVRRAESGRGWFEYAGRLATIESSHPSSSLAVRVKIEAGVRLGDCPSDAALSLLASLPPSPAGGLPHEVPDGVPPVEMKLASDPIADLLAQVRRDEWISANAPRLASLAPEKRELLVVDLARAHLERYVLAAAFAREADPWARCGVRPGLPSFVPLLGAEEADAALAVAEGYVAAIRSSTGRTKRLRQLILLERGDCSGLRASMAAASPVAKAEWLRQQAEARWPDGCPGSGE